MYRPRWTKLMKEPLDTASLPPALEDNTNANGAERMELDSDMASTARCISIDRQAASL